MAIVAIVFDADEVIQYPEPGREAKLAGAVGFVPEPLSQFIAELHAAEDTTLTGAVDFLEVLPVLLARWGMVGKAPEVREWLNLITVDQEVLGLVSRLRQTGYVCALATNQQPHRAHFMARELGYGARFDRCFFSCEMGLAKPDPSYFRALLAELSLDPEQALFLDDKPQNVEAARAIGMHAECFANARDGRAHLELRACLARFGVA